MSDDCADMSLVILMYLIFAADMSLLTLMCLIIGADMSLLTLMCLIIGADMSLLTLMCLMIGADMSLLTLMCLMIGADISLLTLMCLMIVLICHFAHALVSDLICCLFSLPVLIRDGEGGTVHASVDWPPTPYDVCDGVQPACDVFIHFSGHITHCLFLSI